MMRSGGEQIAVFGDAAAENVIWMHCFSDEGEKAYAMLPAQIRQQAALVTVRLSEREWNARLSPWAAPALFKGEPFAGGADAWLQTLTGSIMPEVAAQSGLSPARHLIAGYSLAGLFSLWALYHTDRFSGAASVSGSLWYPDFAEYIRTHKPMRQPEHVYLSLGDRESHARNPVLASVADKTAAISSYFVDAGVHFIYEQNPGGHTNHAAERTAKALKWLIRQYK
ncbi:MAG: alpha/beta hydrolase [Oscillospiraceae bacterium]|nr:alpha/beta hydrolase [Oscillospiraceae bacterium]